MSDAYKNWLFQAENDLSFAALAIREGFFSQCCFLCQQAAEKAVKAVAYFRGATLVKSHSIRLISEDLKLNSELVNAAKILDTYYITARYPDALPDGAPFQSFTKIQASQALEHAGELIMKAKHECKL